MKTGEQETRRQDDSTHDAPKREESNDRTPHTTEGDIANASASDADAGDLGGEDEASE